MGVTDPFVVKAFNQSGGGFLNQTDLRAVLEKMGETGKWDKKVKIFLYS